MPVIGFSPGLWAPAPGPDPELPFVPMPCLCVPRHLAILGLASVFSLCATAPLEVCSL